LEITVLIAVGNASLEHRRQLLDVDDFDNALNLVSARESKPGANDRTEQPVAPDGCPEQFTVFTATAAASGTVCPDDGKSDDVADEWTQLKSTPVHVGG
jgi:hypothetical protein